MYKVESPLGFFVCVLLFVVPSLQKKTSVLAALRRLCRKCMGEGDGGGGLGNLDLEEHGTAFEEIGSQCLGKCITSVITYANSLE